MQTSQTLKDLANSAKASQEEFNNTLIEIHKQSACSIETELKEIYKNEMSETNKDISKQLSVINSRMNEIKTLLTKTQKTQENILNQLEAYEPITFNGVTISTLVVTFLLGMIIVALIK